jgi:adenylosuccinate synthase
MISQLGLGPKNISQIVLVVKCFPTRNRPGGGSLKHELFSPDPELEAVLHEEGGGSYSGGDLQRRVGLFDFEIVKSAVRANSPDIIALTGLDRLHRLIHHPRISDHYRSIDKFILELERTCRVPVALQGWGPNIEAVVDNRAQVEIRSSRSDDMWES